MNKLAQISALTLAAGFATAGSLDLDRAYATELKSDASIRNALNTNAGNIAVTAGTRFNYGINLRDADGLGDDDTTIGFGFQDVEVRLAGQVTDNITATVSFDFGPNDGTGSGDGVQLEDAYADWAVNDSFTLRVGQYIPGFSAEASISEFHTMNTFRSVTHESLGTPSWTQGIEAHFGVDTWGAAVGFNDGPGAENTSYDSSAEADFGFNARFDFYSDSNKARFNDRAAWRGQEAGWRVGAGAIYATYGETNPSTTSSTDAFWYTIDGAYEGDGWGVNAAFYGVSLDPDTGGSTDDFGFELGGNFFFNDQWEGFARWDLLILDDTNFGANVEDTYNFLAGGVNYYFVPESHAAKLTLEVAYSFEETTGADGAFSTYSAPTGVNALSGFLGDSESGELMLSALMQVMF
jgi:hypothetical protein